MVIKSITQKLKSRVKSVMTKTTVMTWIIASPTIFGYGIGVSDIRVTFQDNTTKDCLQKIHKVANNIAIGFAGSVPIGLEMVREARMYLSNNYEDDICNPENVIKEWQKHAQKIFNKSKEIDKKQECHLIIIGCIPQDSSGIYNCHSSVAILKSPEFNPEFINVGDWISTGSGAQKKEYKETIEDLKKEFSFKKMEEGMPGGFGIAAQIILNQTISKIPEKGVSKFLHLCIVGPNEVTISNTNYEITDKNGKVIQYKMPKVATNLEELQVILNMSDETLSGSSCNNVLILNEY